MYSFVFLILLFSAPTFFTIESLVSTRHSTMAYVLFTVIFTMLACLLSMCRVVGNKCFVRKKVLVFLWLIVFLIIGFWATQYRYGSVNSNYLQTFLFMGVQVVPAIIMACFVNKEEIWMWNKSVLVLIMLYTVSVWVCIMRSGGIGLGNQAYNSDINTYASLGYYMAYAYGFTLVSIMNCKFNRAFHIFYGLMLLCILPIQLLAIFTLGGKAPLLMVIAITGLIVMFCNKRLRILLWAFVVVGVSVCLPFWANMSSIQRFLNIANDMSTLERIRLWTEAIEAGMNHFIIGNGIGAEYYVLGFRTHNIFTDVFVEYGIIGPIIVASVLLLLGIELFHMVKCDKKNFILLVLYVNSVITLLVSGYYLSEPAIWGVLIFVLRNKRKKLINCSIENSNAS